MRREKQSGQKYISDFDQAILYRFGIVCHFNISIQIVHSDESINEVNLNLHLNNESMRTNIGLNSVNARLVRFSV